MLDPAPRFLSRRFRPTATKHLLLAAFVAAFVFGGTLALASQGLAAPIEVEGRVLDTDGAPVRDAAVTLFARESNFDRAVRHLENVDAEDTEPEILDTATTDGDGRYRLAAPRAGTVRVRVEADGWLPAVATIAPLVEDMVLDAARLERPVELKVRVTSGGEPASGVLVRAQPAPRRFGQDRWQLDTVWSRTGEDGVARLAVEGETQVWIAASSPDRGVARTETTQRSGTVRFGKVRTRTLQVVDARGEPIDGALLLDAGGGQFDLPMPMLRTDADGLAAVPVAADARSLMVQAEDGRRAKVLLEVPADPQIDPDADGPRVVALPPMRRLAGTVLDKETREPIAGAVVSARRTEVPSEATTDGAGVFEIALGNEEAMLEAEAKSYFVDRRPVGAAAEQAPTFALDPAVSIRGTVVDAEGQPVAGAEIRGTSQVNPMGGRTFRFDNVAAMTVSAENGSFELTGLRPEKPYDLAARADGFAKTTAQATAPARGEAGEPLTLEMQRGARAFGLVVDEAERPVAGARVEIEPQSGGNPMEQMIRRMTGSQDTAADVVSGADGRFSVADLPSGRFSMKVSGSGFAAVQIPGLEVAQREREVDLGTVVLGPGAEIRGLVVDSDGAPIRGAEIRVSEQQGGMVRFNMAFPTGGADAVTGADGTFVAGDLVPGQRVTLYARKSGYAPGNAEGVQAPNEQPVEITLRRTGAVAGTVYDAQGAPLEGAKVEAKVAMGMGMNIARPIGDTTTDDTGRFRLADLPPDPVQVHASADGYQPGQVDDIVVEENETTDGVELRLEPGARLVGIVRGADGEPAIGAEVQVAEDGGGGPMARMFGGGGNSTDGDGRYQLDGLEVGRRTIEASSEGLKVAKVIEIRPGTNRLDLSLATGQSVRGQVVRPDGAAVPGASVGLRPIDEFRTTTSATTRGDGTFELENVPAGTYQVVVEAQGLARMRTSDPVVVADQPVGGLLVELTDAASLVGRLLGLEFDDLGSAQVVAMSDNGMQLGEVDFEGGYRVDGLAPGQWTIRGSTGSGRRVSAQVEVEDGVAEVQKDLDFSGGETLEVLVTADGASVGGAMVMAVAKDGEGSAFANTDHQGRVILEGLEPGRYSLRAMDLDGGRQAEVEAEVPGPAVELEMRTLELTGRITDAYDGRPLSGVEVETEPDDEEGGRMRFFSRIADTSDDLGRYRLRGVAEGQNTVIARKTGYGTARQEATILGEGTSLDFVLEPADGLWAQVSRADGATVNSVRLVVLDQNEGVVADTSLTPDDAGYVYLSTVPPGSYRIVAVAPGSAVVETDAAVPGDRPALILPQGGVIQVETRGGSNAAGRVRLLRADGSAFRTPGFSGFQDSFGFRLGKATISGVPPGTWAVEVDFAGTTTTHSLTVTGAGLQRLEVDAPAD